MALTSTLRSHTNDQSLRGLLIAKLDADTLELPMVPDTAAAVVAACRDEDTGPRTVARIMERDAALAAHVLRLSNSALYSPAQPIVSLAQAINRLGLVAVSEITLAVALRSKVFRAEGYEALVGAVWEHSAAAGAWAREIARMKRSNVEGAFLCGLLHDVGRPVILQATVDLGRQQGRRFPADEVKEVMDELHARVGAELIRRWGLPPWMVAAVEFHHDVDAATEHHEEALVTALADRLARWTLEDDADHTEELHALKMIADLNVYPDELDELLGARERVRSAAEAFA